MTGDLQFDAASHAFTWRGQPVPSVTQVLRDMGLQTNWFKDDPRYRERGSAVHLAAQLICEGVFDRDGTHPDLLPYTDGFERFVADTGFRALPGGETPVYSASLKLAGIPDMPGVMPGGQRWLLDIKTGEAAPRGVELQLALYRLMLGAAVDVNGEEVAMEFNAVKCLLLPKSGQYRLIDCSDARWLKYAQDAVGLWWLRKSWGLLNGRELT